MSFESRKRIVRSHGNVSEQGPGPEPRSPPSQPLLLWGQGGRGLIQEQRGPPGLGTSHPLTGRKASASPRAPWGSLSNGTSWLLYGSEDSFEIKGTPQELWHSGVILQMHQARQAAQAPMGLTPFPCPNSLSFPRSRVPSPASSKQPLIPIPFFCLRPKSMLKSRFSSLIPTHN